MSARRHGRAFSLIEVVMAVGLFAGSVGVLLALLPSVMRQGVESAETMAAARLPDALRVELTRLAAHDFAGLVMQAPVMDHGLADGLEFVASRDTARMHSRVYLPPETGAMAESDQYFLLECWRFPDEPLRSDPSRHSLALVVRVSWPYRTPGTTGVVPLATRSRLMFAVSLAR